MLSILLVVAGIYWIEKFFSEKKKKYFGLAVLVMVLAIFTYQCTLALFVILSIPFAMKNAKNFKEYFFNGLALGITFLIAAVANLLACKYIFKSARFVEDTNIFANLKSIIWYLCAHGVITFDILPWGVFLVITLVIFISVLVWSRTCQRTAWRIFNAFMIVIAACVFSTAAQLQGSGYFIARTVYPLGSIPAALAVDLFVNKEEAPVDESKKKKLRNISMAALGVLMIFQYFSFTEIFIDKYRVNALDQYRYQYIGQAILEYEESTGTEIKQVAFYTDAHKSQPQYSDIQFNPGHFTGDLTISAFLTSWSDLNAMNYFLHTDYKKAPQSEEYIEYFASKDWDTLSKDQLIFDGDTLHICVY